MSDPVKIPSRDIFNLNNQTFSTAEIEEVLFEEIGGTELINLTRHDTVDGLNVFYSIISDLTKTTIEYDPAYILTNVPSYEKYESQFPINLSSKIPSNDYKEESILLADTSIAPNIYFSSDKKIILELENIQSDEIVQIFFFKNATINTVRENDY